MNWYRKAQREPRLALELLCGASDAPPEHPGYFEPGSDFMHPKHAEVKAWADGAGIENNIAGNMQDEVCYSDAYLYFDPERLDEVARALREIGIEGDILDVKGRLTSQEKLLVKKVADSEGWRVNW